MDGSYTQGCNVVLADNFLMAVCMFRPMLMFVLMFLLMSAKDLVLERKQRTLDRLRLAHPSTTDLVAGFFLAGMVVGLAQAVVLLLGDGEKAAGAEIVRGGLPFTLGRAVWKALASTA